MFSVILRGKLMIVILVLALVVLGSSAIAVSQNETVLYAYSDQSLLHFDPSDIYSVTIVWFNVYETLLRYHPQENAFEGILAESYEASPDGLTWTFHLREGVKFHTGNLLTADCVKSSIERTKERGAGIAYIWDSLKEIEIIDNYTVVFHLQKALALDLMVSSLAGAYIFDPEYSDHEWFLEGNDSGTGPYRFSGHQGLEGAVIERFDEYWGGWKEDQIDTVIFKTVRDATTRKLMLESGAADFTNRLAFEMLESVDSNPLLDIVEAPTWQEFEFNFNVLKPPLDNKLVRKALAYSIPYDEIISGVLFGYGERSRGWIPSTLWGWSENTRRYSYNLTVARVLLQEAGYPNGGFSLVLTYGLGDETQRRTAELWKEKLAKLNIGLSIRPMPWDGQVGLAHDPDPEKRQDVFVKYHWPFTPNPVLLMKKGVYTQVTPLLNVSYYSNPVVDSLLDYAESIAGTDREAAACLLSEVDNIVLEDAPVAPIADLIMVAVKASSLEGPDWAFGNPAYPRIVDWYNVLRPKE